MNLNICLMQVDNKSYRLLLLDSHTLDCIEKSYNFNISEGQAIGLYVENGVLYILGESSEKEKTLQNRLRPGCRACQFE